jgi:hypothetical protein
MEKYGVVVEEPPKEATDKQAEVLVCPFCNAPLEKGANVSKCPAHGTKPWEPNPPKVE